METHLLVLFLLVVLFSISQHHDHSLKWCMMYPELHGNYLSKCSSLERHSRMPVLGNCLKCCKAKRVGKCCYRQSHALPITLKEQMAMCNIIQCFWYIFPHGSGCIEWPCLWQPDAYIFSDAMCALHSLNGLINFWVIIIIINVSVTI